MVSRLNYLNLVVQISPLLHKTTQVKIKVTILIFVIAMEHWNKNILYLNSQYLCITENGNPIFLFINIYKNG